MNSDSFCHLGIVIGDLLSFIGEIQEKLLCMSYWITATGQ